MASSEEFLSHGKCVMEHLVSYLQNIDDHPVLPSVPPGYLQDQLPDRAPEQPESFEDIMKDFERAIKPGLVHLSSPHFHGFYPLGNTYPSILADILSNGLCQFPIAWQNGPAATELEMLMMNWLAKMMNLPKEFQFRENSIGGGFIQGTASEACLLAMMAAKARTTFLQRKQFPEKEVSMEMINSKFVMYCSKQAHSMSKRTSLMTSVTLRILEVDENQRLSGQTLKEAVSKDLEDGLIPMFCVATLGTTSCCSFDKLEELGPICQENNIWMHVDAAYAGAAFICPEFQHLLKGVEFAESFCFNPYKWMLVNFDCSTIWFKDTTHFINYYNDDPVYLKHDRHGIIPDFHHWEIPLGHRMRSLKLWFVIRMYGVEGLRKFIRKHVELAKSFEKKIIEHPLFEISAPTNMGLVCFRLANQSNDVNRALVTEINGRKIIYVTPCQLGDNFVIRFVVSSDRTEEEHIQFGFDEICESARIVLERPASHLTFKDATKKVINYVRVVNHMKHLVVDDTYVQSGFMLDHAWL